MRKRRKKRGNQFFSSLMIVILLPLLVTTVMQSMKLEKLISGQSVYVESATEAVYESGEGSLLWGGAGETEETEQNRELEQKVLFVAAKEIGADYEDAAIMAQCVIARTNLYDAAKNQTAEPQGLSMEEMQTLWGEDFNRIYQKFSECAGKTADEVLTWDGSYIYAAYHAISSGRTRNMSDLYGDADMPYLMEKECHGDTSAKGYLSVYYFEEEDFLSQCRETFGTKELDSAEKIQIEGRDASDYVLKMKVGDTECTGEEFRTAFELPSACFTVTKIDDKVRIVTKGVGHGFGLSQHTAETMAEEGKSYREILEYFYPGAEITKAQKIQ